MSLPNWNASGTYFETCDCETACPCVFLSPATNGSCDVVLAWRINHGKFGNVNLDGLKVAIAAHSPKTNRIMFDGNWKVALYVDKNATESQSDALVKIWGGQAGGAVFPMVAKMIAQMLGVKKAAIEFQSTDGKLSVAISNVMNATVEIMKGAGDRTIEISNLPTAFATPTKVARSIENKYTDYDMNWNYSAKNGFYGDFAYTGP